MEKLTQNISELQKKLNDISEKYNDSKRKIEALQEELHQFQVTVEALQFQISQNESEIQFLKEINEDWQKTGIKKLTDKSGEQKHFLFSHTIINVQKFVQK